MEKVMRIKSVEGGIGRTIVARFLPGTDMLEGIEEVCRRHDVKYAVVACAVGAFKKATFVYPIPQAGTPIGIKYSDPVTIEGPVEFLGGQGIVCQSDDGKYLLHFHGSASDKEMHIWGGHFVTGNVVLATLDVIINEISGVNMVRRFDEETGFVQFSPEKLEG